MHFHWKNIVGGGQYSLVQQGVFPLRLEQSPQPGLHHDVGLLGGVVWKGALKTDQTTDSIE